MTTARTIELSDLAIRDLAYMASHASMIAVILDAISVLNELPQGLGDLYVTISQSTGIPEIQVRRIVRALLNIQRVRGRLRIAPSALFDLLTTSADRQDTEQWPIARQSWIDSRGLIERAFAELGSDHPLAVIEKTGQLTYAHQNILSESRIITDIRPVFGANGRTVLRAIITHNLLLEYYDGTERHRMEVVLDSIDIEDLRRVCERALEKEIVLKDQLDALHWNISIPHATEND